MRTTRVSLAVSACALAAIILAPIALADTSGTLPPVSDGTYLQWTPSSAAAHYTLVDEPACNGNTDYVRTVTAGQRDSYGVNVAAIPDGAKITQISVTPCASKNSGGGLTSFMNVFYRFNGANSGDAGNYSLTGTVPTTLATVSFGGLSLLKSSTSVVEIGAVYSAGNKGVRLSKIAAVITYTALAAPTGLAATNSGAAISLHWTDNSSVEDGFKIERSTDGGAFSQIGTSGPNVVDYKDTTVSGNHSYGYQVRAYNAAGNSGYSNTATANTNTIPVAPTNLTATASGAVKIALRWTDNATNETQYKVERKTGTGSFGQIKTLGANTVTYTDTGSGGLTYTYRVRASNAVGNSGYSNEASATLP